MELLLKFLNIFIDNAYQLLPDDLGLRTRKDVGLLVKEYELTTSHSTLDHSGIGAVKQATDSPSVSAFRIANYDKWEDKTIYEHNDANGKQDKEIVKDNKEKAVVSFSTWAGGKQDKEIVKDNKGKAVRNFSTHDEEKLTREPGENSHKRPRKVHNSQHGNERHVKKKGFLFIVLSFASHWSTVDAGRTANFTLTGNETVKLMLHINASSKYYLSAVFLGKKSCTLKYDNDHNGSKCCCIKILDASKETITVETNSSVVESLTEINYLEEQGEWKKHKFNVANFTARCNLNNTKPFPNGADFVLHLFPDNETCYLNIFGDLSPVTSFDIFWTIFGIIAACLVVGFVVVCIILRKRIKAKAKEMKIFRRLFRGGKPMAHVLEGACLREVA